MSKKYILLEPEIPSGVNEPIAAPTIQQPANVPMCGEREDELRQRLSLAAQDAREGRTMSCEEVHARMEEKFPWLCV